MSSFFHILSLTTYLSIVSISLLAKNVEGILLPRLINKHIVGGKDTTIEKYAYQVSVRSPNIFIPGNPIEHWCGGSIYSDRLIITAAHCFYGYETSQFEVLAGSTYREGNNGYIAPVAKIIINKNFNASTMINDIAILVLNVSLPLNNRNMKAIQLAEYGPYEGEIGTVTGWGSSESFGSFADILQEVKVPIISNEICSQDYVDMIFDSMFCAGYRGIGGKDSCQGDSGGPLVVNGRLSGIISWGRGCGRADSPGVYAKVSYLRPWILDRIRDIFEVKTN